MSTYAVSSNTGHQTALIFFVICLAGNVINVVMEEGVFRGLFQKLLGFRYSFMGAAVISSVLFGLWHVTELYGRNLKLGWSGHECSDPDADISRGRI